MSIFDADYGPNNIYFLAAASIAIILVYLWHLLRDARKLSESQPEQLVPLDAPKPFSSKDDLFRSKWSQMNVPMPGRTEWETQPMPVLTNDDLFLLRWADLNEQYNDEFTEETARLMLALEHRGICDEDEDAVPEDPDKDIPQQERLPENAGLLPGMWQAGNYQEILYIAEWYMALFSREDERKRS